MKTLSLLLITFLLGIPVPKARALARVPVAFVEALSPRDSTSSEKFKKDFEASIEIGRKLTETKLKTCGYELQPKTAFYDAGDTLQAKELAKTEEKNGTWMLVGPRRSNHYLALVSGAANTPTVSLMATATEVGALGPLHQTIAPLNSKMAEIAAVEAKTRTKGASTYLSVVNGDCLSCVDFASHFDAKAKSIGLKKAEELTITGDVPDVTKVLESVRKNPSVKFILLPNYSKSSIHVMNSLDGEFFGFYVGADGWGDSKFGYVQKASRSDQINGFMVRGFPPVESGLKSFSLGRAILKLKTEEIPNAGPSLSVFKIFNVLTDTLCGSKARDSLAFSKAFQKDGKKFSAPWGVSIYDLKSGEISYKRSLGVN